jgi:hypothetical protein
VVKVVDDYEGYDGPRIIVTERRHRLLERTVVTCWTCEASVRVGDAFDTDLGWGVIEIPADDGTDVVAWECPSCGEPASECES